MVSPIDVPGVRSKLVGLDAWLDAAAQSDARYDDDKIAAGIPAAIRRFERETLFRVNPIQVVTYSDGTYAPIDIATGGLANDTTTPVYVADPYDYYQADAREFFVTTLKERPIQTVQRLRVMWSKDDLVYTLPSEWYVWDSRAGRFWILPVRGAAQITGATIAFAQLQIAFGFKPYIPKILCYDYIAGLPIGWQNLSEWADVKRVLEEAAAFYVLNDISQLFDAGTPQKSISSDGISQNLSYDRFMQRKGELAASVESFKATLVAQETPLMMVSL